MLLEIAKLPTPASMSPPQGSALRLQSPTFTPLQVEMATTPVVAGGANTVQRAPPYDGCSAWVAYRTQFEMLARVNCWSEEE